MRKRIVYIVQSEGGGVGRYLELFMNNLDTSMYEQVLICSNGYLEDEEKYSKISDVIEYVDMKRDISISNDIKAIKEVRKLLKKYKPDIIYLHSSKAGAIGRVANCGLGYKCIYNPHGWAFDISTSKIKRNIYILLERMLAKLCDNIIAISDHEKISAIENRICEADKLIVVYNGIDEDGYIKAIKDDSIDRNEIDIPKGAIVFGMVGRISEQKSPDIFVDVALKLQDILPNSYFIIVGDGPLRGEVEKRIKEFKLEEKFYITGWVENVYRYINLFDIALLLSRWEGFGLVIAEYMLAKKPVIATNVGGISNLIINGLDGVLVEPEDVVNTVEAILKVVGDTEFKDNIVHEANIKVKEKFNIKRVVLEHEDIFNRLINNN